MPITITLQDLRDLDACDRGHEDFAITYGASNTWDKWELEDQKEFLAGELAEYFGWAVEKGFFPLWSFADQDLRGWHTHAMDVGRGNFSQVLAEDCQWTHAFLPDAVFVRARLRGVDLNESVLAGATFFQADLRDVDFEGANLMDANLSCANVRHANFRHAELVGANIIGAYSSLHAPGEPINCPSYPSCVGFDRVPDPNTQFPRVWRKMILDTHTAVLFRSEALDGGCYIYSNGI